MIDVFTKDGIKIGTMSKKEYYSLKGDDIPWIKCCTCFVIDDKEKKILFEKRGKRFLDPGKLDLCSGHVQSGEPPKKACVRELGEELGVPDYIGSNVYHLGKMAVDYTKLEDETNRKRLKCFVDVYALKMSDISEVEVDHREAIHIGWLNFEDSIGFIKNSMTRMPYEESLVPQYENVFQNLKDYMFCKNKSEKARND